MTEQSKIPLPEGEKGKSLFERAEGAFGGFDGFTPAPVPKQLAEPANRRVPRKPEAATVPETAETQAAPTPEPVSAAVAVPSPASDRIAFAAEPQRIDPARLREEGLIVPGGPVTALVEEFRIVKRQVLLASRAARLDAIPGAAQRVLVC
jgi:hypothetical protein